MMQHKTPQEFDHIVIGAGSAGCTVARRLVDAGRSVALVEAGGDGADPRILTPNRAWELWESEFDWAYKTVPQRHAAHVEVQTPRGRVLGGSSALNGMIYVRGDASDFDSWSYNGAPGWSYAECLPFFTMSEDYAGGADEFHGTGGPLPVERYPAPNPAVERFLDACAQASVPLNDDCNGPSILGAGLTMLTVRDGLRVSSYRAFIEPIADDPLLTVITGALVTRIVFDGTRAVGVAFEQNGELQQIHSRGELVLSAGALNSPHLLMLSGVGAADELAAHDIPVVADSRGVGKNLHDHFLVPVVAEALVEIEDSVSSMLEAHFFAKSDERMLAPDLQPIMLALAMPVRDAEVPARAITFYAGVVRPLSRGTVSLVSADPHVLPAIDPAYLAERQDMEATLAAVAICRDIMRRPALDGLRGTELFPGAEVTGEALEDYIRHQVQTYHHHVGTCRMGLDDAAVVDPELRANGIQNLRIADASVMPSITSGNTHAPTVMIGERAARFILDA